MQALLSHCLGIMHGNLEIKEYVSVEFGLSNLKCIHPQVFDMKWKIPFLAFPIERVPYR
jgi:hypothetical protein